jgi:DNA methylase
MSGRRHGTPMQRTAITSPATSHAQAFALAPRTKPRSIPASSGRGPTSGTGASQPSGPVELAPPGSLKTSLRVLACRAHARGGLARALRDHDEGYLREHTAHRLPRRLPRGPASPARRRPRRTPGTAGHHPPHRQAAGADALARPPHHPAGGVVLDLFVGTGTTLHACLLEGMHGIGIEFDESYAALSAHRLRSAAQTAALPGPPNHRHGEAS